MYIHTVLGFSGKKSVPEPSCHRTLLHAATPAKASAAAQITTVPLRIGQESSVTKRGDPDRWPLPRGLRFLFIERSSAPAPAISRNPCPGLDLEFQQLYALDFGAIGATFESDR